MAEYKETPIDTLCARIDQARGVLSAISVGYDDDENEFILGPKYMRKAIDAAQELLDQASSAMMAYLDAENAKRKAD